MDERHNSPKSWPTVMTRGSPMTAPTVNASPRVQERPDRAQAYRAVQRVRTDEKADVRDFLEKREEEQRRPADELPEETPGSVVAARLADHLEHQRDDDQQSERDVKLRDPQNDVGRQSVGDGAGRRRDGAGCVGPNGDVGRHDREAEQQQRRADPPTQPERVGDGEQREQVRQGREARAASSAAR